MANSYQLAQLNVGRTVAPLDTDQLAGFVAALGPTNERADLAPGFVWRMQTEDGDATGIKPIEDDPLFITNLSVWSSVEALADFVYHSSHVEIMRQRRQWFEAPTEAITVLWWVPTGHRPSLDEALDRLAVLRRDGAGAYAFSFREPYPAPDSLDASATGDDWLCPA